MILESISSLHPHEETLRFLVDEIMNSMKRKGAQLDPIVIDRKTKVVLDGMHRMEALRSMGLQSVLAYSIDYSNPAIKVGRWTRCLKDVGNSLVERMRAVLRLEEVKDPAEAMSIVDQFKAPLAIFTRKNTYVSSLALTSPFEAYELIREFDQEVQKTQGRLYIEPDSKPPPYLLQTYSMVLYPVRLRKDDVVKAGRSCRPFPPKSSRHLIPSRPRGLQIPLEWLARDYSPKSSAQRLQLLLRRADRVWAEG